MGAFHSVATGLREGVETRPMFDRRSRVVYSIIAAECVIGAASSSALGFTYDLPLNIVSLGCVLIGCAFLLRRIIHQRVAGAIETSVLSLLHGFATVFVIFPLLTISGPFADPWLEQADKALGFDWFALIHFFAKHPAVLAWILVAYRSIFWQPFVIAPALWFIGRGDRAWVFVTALSIGLVIALAIYPFAPADAAFTHFGVTRAQYPLHSGIPWTTGPVVHEFKAGARHVTLDKVVGLVTFPSYHAVITACLVWAAWPLRWARWFFVPLNAVVMLSCILVGAHYLVDVIAGTGIAVIAIHLARKAVKISPCKP